VTALEPASSLSTHELAELFNAAYEGYVVPFRLSEPALRFMLEAFDYDLEASLLARDGDGAELGLALLALRGPESWCGGIGVVPAGRGTGVGERMMRALLDSARARGAERMRLEVIDRNEAARALYAKLGFEHVRDVEVWSLDSQAGGPPSPAPVDEAHRWIRARRQHPEPWQRADETVARFRAMAPAPEGVLVEGGAAIVRVTGPRVQLVQGAAEDAPAAERLLRAAAARGESLHALNLPEDDLVAGAFRALGGRRDVRQHELELRL
jgi:ribosomal protein S18 acetylase RimI-like enzyme